MLKKEDDDEDADDDEKIGLSFIAEITHFA